MVSPSQIHFSHDDQKWDVPLDGQIRIGRGKECEVRIEDPLISRVHAIVELDGEAGWVLRDNGSTNGTFLDGTPAEMVPLGGDEVTVLLGNSEHGPALSIGPIRVEVEDLTVAQLDTTAATTVVTERSNSPRRRDVEATVLEGATPQPFRSVKRSLADLTPGAEVITIGSAPDNTIQVDDVLVSRHHVRITKVDQGFLVEDANSLNGTYVNGQLILSGLVDDGDRLTIGHTDFVCQAGKIVLLRDAAPERGGLEVRQLDFTIPDGKRLLHGIDFSAKRGTLTAVIGPSGAGKSTLSRVLTGLTVPSAGTVEFDDFDVHADYALVSPRIGLVPQDDVLHRQLKVKDALDYAALLRLPAGTSLAARERKVSDVVNELGLGGHELTRIDRLSGGQRKRASVALELLTEPSLLILDEPTSGLDPALDRQVMTNLRELADGDRAVIVITHSVAYLDLCDQVLVLAPGGLPAYLGAASGLVEHFGTADWADIFAGLTDDPTEAYEKYRRKAQPKRRFGDYPLAASVMRIARTTLSWRGWLTQLATLIRRQFSLFLADRGYLAFLAVLPVILGLLALVVPGDSGFTQPDPNDQATAREPSDLLALLIVGASFFGASISIRDLVGERAIYLRERAVGLSVSAYLVSKILVFGAIAWAGTFVMVGIVFLGKNPPDSRTFFGDPKFELFFAVGVTAVTSMILSLAISALVRSNEQAMPILIVLLMSQLVFHGGMIPVTGRAILDQLSWLVPARWGFAAGASGMDISRLVPFLKEDWLWDHDAARWLFDIGILFLLSAVFSGVTYYLLADRRRRP
jgi:ABC transport system ATP-binding/permease protein